MIEFTLLEKPTPCPSSSNCSRFTADPAGDCDIGYEREAGANACDFVRWIEKPASTFDEHAVAKAFGVPSKNLEAARS